MADKDQYQATKAMMLAQLDVLMGGRVAEELCFGSDRVTTGASDDMKKASRLASAMVKEYGFSEKVDFIIKLILLNTNVYIILQVGLRDCSVQDRSGLVVTNEFSEQTSQLIDQEINRLLNVCLCILMKCNRAYAHI